MRAKGWLKPLAHGVAALPLLFLLFGWFELLALNPASLRLSAEPVAYSHNALGLMALRLLWATLAITPLVRLLGWGWAMPLRRLLGLWAFAYAAAHLLFFMAMELDWSLMALWDSLVKRNFILAGIAAFLAILPLAATSSRRAIRALGAKRWQRLHRLIYPAAICAAVHFILRVKGFQWEPWLYLLLLVALLAVRLWPRTPRASPG